MNADTHSQEQAEAVRAYIYNEIEIMTRLVDESLAKGDINEATCWYADHQGKIEGCKETLTLLGLQSFLDNDVQRAIAVNVGTQLQKLCKYREMHADADSDMISKLAVCEAIKKNA